MLRLFIKEQEMGEKLRIGIYGGTFNPIHLGHIHILREFIRRLSLTRVLLIPDRLPPHKEVHDLASGEDRAQMCRIAAEKIEEAPVEVSDIELRSEGKSYTANTLKALSRQYPGDELYLLMGEDMFLTVDRWFMPEVIFSLSAVCASPRSEDGFQALLRKKEELEKSYGARCFVEEIPYLPVSSTEVRERLKRGESVARLVPKGVERYLLEHGLYRENEEEMEK